MTTTDTGESPDITTLTAKSAATSCSTAQYHQACGVPISAENDELTK